MTEVYSLACEPRGGPPRPTMRRSVANFGIGSHPKKTYDPNKPQSVLGGIVCGFEEDRGKPWLVYAPDAIPGLRTDVLRAIDIAKKQQPADDMADWWQSQLEVLDEVLRHAADKQEWVASVFEGLVPCFLKGGTGRYEAGTSLWSPTCTPYEAEKPSPRRFIPLGASAVLLVGFGIASWRHRRFLQRLVRDD